MSTVPLARQPNTSHEDCQRQIKNLESTVTKLRASEVTQGIQISSRDTQIEQLQASMGGLEWLRTIAERQSGSIERYVRADCWILDNSLTADPLFIDFRVGLYSCSVYTLSVVGLSGSIRADNRRLGLTSPADHLPRIETNDTQDLKIGETGYLTISQRLTREDAVFILNGSHDFMFDGLFIELRLAEIDRAARFNPDAPIPKGEFREKYPKLVVHFQLAGWFHVVKQEDWSSDHQVITLEVTIENTRQNKIDIESIQLSVVNLGHPRLELLPDTGEIYERKFVADESIKTFGKRLKNLAASRLAIIGNGKVSGYFQFIVENVSSDALKGATVSLILTDNYGEYHVANHDLRHVNASS